MGVLFMTFFSEECIHHTLAKEAVRLGRAWISCIEMMRQEKAGVNGEE